MTTTNDLVEQLGIAEFTSNVKELFGDEWNEDYIPQIADYFEKNKSKKIRVALRQCKNTIMPPMTERRLSMDGWYLGCREFGYTDKAIQKYVSRGCKAAVIDSEGVLHELLVWGSNEFLFDTKYEIQYVESDKGKTLRMLKVIDKSAPPLEKLTLSHIEQWENDKLTTTLLKLNSKITQNNTGKTKHPYYYIEDQVPETDGKPRHREGISFKIAAHDEKGEKCMVDIEPATYGIINIDSDLIGAVDVEAIKNAAEKGLVKNALNGQMVDGNVREQMLQSLLAGFDIVIVGTPNISQDRRYINISPMAIYLSDTLGKTFVEINPPRSTAVPSQAAAENRLKKDVENIFKMTSSPVDEAVISNFLNPRPTIEGLAQVLKELVAEGFVEFADGKWVKK